MGLAPRPRNTSPGGAMRAAVSLWVAVAVVSATATPAPDTLAPPTPAPDTPAPPTPAPGTQAPPITPGPWIPPDESSLGFDPSIFVIAVVVGLVLIGCIRYVLCGRYSQAKPRMQVKDADENEMRFLDNQRKIHEVVEREDGEGDPAPPVPIGVAPS
eukprot:TRINITY_DN19630_c0_g1_i1.p1 TRINITY_DN19630_c0_g1~~TRINITY_DN19630_c0_g1_i1.p1  ORF type:complete len:157 (+),score=31.51 TRINITY_DN19630_c0_g1_i1:60-530(+)